MKIRIIIYLQTFVMAVCMAAVCPAFGQGQARQIWPDEVTLKGKVELPLNLTDHLPVIEARINGSGPYRFALDTGFGGMIQVTPAIAKKLGLPVVGEVKTGDPSGRNPKTARLFHADSVDVGAAHIKGIVVGEFDRPGLLEADGIIGLNIFNKLLVKLDYVGGKFTLENGSLAKDAISYSTPHGVPSIEIDVNGTKVNTDIDSGSPAEVSLPLAMAKSLTLVSEPVVVGRGRSSDGEFQIYSAALKGEVRVGGITLKNPQLDFLSVFPVGNLGFRFLKSTMVTFDSANQKVRFEKPGPN